jgi:hypothetical protein
MNRAPPVSPDHTLSVRSEPYCPGCRWIPAGATALGIVGLAGMAFAQEPGQPPMCGTPQQMAATLAQHGEHPQGMGVSRTGKLVTMWSDPADGSWTVTFTTPTNPPVACIQFMGNGWQERRPAAQGNPA